MVQIRTGTKSSTRLGQDTQIDHSVDEVLDGQGDQQEPHNSHQDANAGVSQR
jgi:hypothetical protein